MSFEFECAAFYSLQTTLTQTTTTPALFIAGVLVTVYHGDIMYGNKITLMEKQAANIRLEPRRTDHPPEPPSPPAAVSSEGAQMLEVCPSASTSRKVEIFWIKLLIK